MLIFHSASSLHSLSGSLKAVLVVWVQRPSGLASILLTSLSLSLVLGTRCWWNYKACKMTGLTAMRRAESGEWKMEQRFESSLVKKGLVKEDLREAGKYC